MILLDMLDIEIILCIDWLTPHPVVLDCYAKTLTLVVPGIPLMVWEGLVSCILVAVISYAWAQWLVAAGCLTYLAFVCDVSSETSFAGLVQ